MLVSRAMAGLGLGADKQQCLVDGSLEGGRQQEQEGGGEADILRLGKHYFQTRFGMHEQAAKFQPFFGSYFLNLFNSARGDLLKSLVYYM